MLAVKKEIFYVLDEHEDQEGNNEKILNNKKDELKSEQPSKKYKMEIIWKNVVIMASIHCFALYGLTQLGRAKLPTVLFAIILIFHAMMGVVVGI